LDAQSQNTYQIAFLVFAHNESAVVEKTVKAIRASLEEGDELFVIADNCSDNTAEVAEKAGSLVFIRKSDNYGKGAALAWFFETNNSLISGFDRVIILDADSMIESGFSREIKLQISNTYPVMQCCVSPIGYSSSAIGTIIAFSEFVEQSVFNRIKSVFGWSVRLRGTGMVFSPKILESVTRQLRTEVEDIELTLLLAAKKFKIKMLVAPKVFDPKPEAAIAAARQRARWFRGQWETFWMYRSEISRIMLQGPGGWFLLTSLFLKPRWLMFILKIILTFVFLQIPVVSAIFGVLAFIDLFLFSIGFFQLKQKNMFLRAILSLPGFMLMWLKSIFLSFKRSQWLSARTSEIDPEKKNK
jgi:cellulose synthase/poly-beta-1,6-N-acetylglucosamine synthase-like glycosyltransferase